MTGLDKSHILIKPEVELALSRKEPVVALESTVITHGLPYPENRKLALDLEEEVRSKGGIPATIAILEGQICIGLDRSQMDLLIQAGEVVKVSARDIASTVATCKYGGTTVAGTLAIATAVGIQVFATGGIGGVHRQAPFDVSADLLQLSRSPLIVVCAGAKAILDVPATLEVLETYSVPVVGYQTNEFPAFYSTSSGLPVSTRADSPEDVAHLARTHWSLGFNSALLVAVPPPPEVAIPAEQIEAAIQRSLQEAQEKHLHGQPVTPFLLRRVSELTGGLSLKTNLELLKNNARTAAMISQVL